MPDTMGMSMWPRLRSSPTTSLAAGNTGTSRSACAAFSERAMRPPPRAVSAMRAAHRVGGTRWPMKYSRSKNRLPSSVWKGEPSRKASRTGQPKMARLSAMATDAPRSRSAAASSLAGRSWPSPMLALRMRMRGEVRSGGGAQQAPGFWVQNSWNLPAGACVPPDPDPAPPPPLPPLSDGAA